MAKIETSVFYLKGNPELKAEFQAIGVRCHKLWSGKGIMTFLRIVFRNRKVIFHAHLPRAELVATLFGIILRIRVVLSKHNAEQFAPGIPKNISRFLAKFVNKHSSAIIFISEAARSFAIRNNELEERCLRKTHVVHYGIPDIQSESTLRKNNNLLNKSILKIGTLSRLEKQKNLGILISACYKMKEKGIKFSCDIYGRGSLEEELKKQIHDSGLQNHVRLKGFTHDKYNMLVDLDLFVLTSHYEGFGLVLLEAMSAKVPIVASNSEAAIEVLGEESPSLFNLKNSSSLYDKLLEMGCNKILRKQVLQDYEKRLKLFSVEGMFRQIRNIYSI